MADGLVPRDAGAAERRRLDDAARQELRQRAAEIVETFLGEPNRRLSSARQLRWGTHGSFSLHIQGDKAGLWFDHENGRGGDMIDFIAVQLGSSMADAIAYALRHLGPSFGVSKPIIRRAAVRPELDDADRIQRALDIWSGVRPLRGTVAELYLARRGLFAFDETRDVLGFHPACPIGSTTMPALVALIEDITTGEPLGIHRRPLTADGGAAGAAMTLGPKGQGVIRLWPAVTTELVIGEGVETCLAAMVLGAGPTWSVLDAGGLAKFPVLPEIEQLTVLVDHDVSKTGQRAADECRKRWVAAGKRVELLMPDAAGEDINDVVLAKLWSSLRA
jgi:putative DNA primase/helicase